MIETNASKLEFEDDELEYVLSKGKEKTEVVDRLASAITIVPWLTEWFPGVEPQGDDTASMVHYQDGSYVIPKYAGGVTHEKELFIAYSGKHGCVSNETEFIKELDQLADEGKQILFLTEQFPNMHRPVSYTHLRAHET